MKKKKLSVAFLWHMHQPLYKDLITGEYHLPWVRLHSTYSYLDMVSIIDKYPKAKATFNFTPSLIWQLLDIANGKASKDKFFELSVKNADKLTPDDKFFILKNFFSCDLEKAILPSKRYRELFYKRDGSLRKEDLLEKAKDFTTDDFLDLQVHFNLAWCGFTLRDEDKLIKGLVHKDKGFTENNKKYLLKKQERVAASILPEYKRLQDEGRIEISTSPFYHPILPLLCKEDAAEGSDMAADARVQISRGIKLYEEVFGRKPVGMWPPEGSVSQEMIAPLADEGIKWIATDEGILLESFKGEGIPRDELIYKAYTVEEKGRKLDIIFRDINISNAIGFRYAHMSSKRAAADLCKDLSGIRKSVEEREGEHVAGIILDGENPWPYYPDGGKVFLSEIYKHLSSSKDAELVTISEYMDIQKEKKKINKLFAGSWIDRNFNKWIGSPQKNKAWHYLHKARDVLMSSGRLTDEALEELYIAEGSDWFWWYDDFGSELNFVFDDLFRLHLSNMYTLSGRKPPHYLSEQVSAGPTPQKLPESSTPLELGRQLKVLFVSSEVVPFAKTGGLADVAGSLPKALASMGCDVRVIMPLYRSVKGSKFDLVKEHVHIENPLSTGGPKFSLYSTREGGITTYFVNKRRFFLRGGLYGGAKGDYSDNGLRFGFFSKAVLRAMKAIDFKPDIIHCNDWQSALIPFYLKFQTDGDDFYKGIKTLFTIHNMAYQGVFKSKIMHRLGIPEKFFNMNNFEFYGKLSFMKSGILYSDAVSTVSHKYAEEIMTPEYGCGLDGLLRMKKDTLYGIPNGADYSVWSPKNDKNIKTNYDASTIEKKLDCKNDLLEYTKLPLPLNAPILGCVTRLAEQKGMDLFANIMDKVVALGAGVVLLGKGSEQYNKLFEDLAKKYPKNIYVCNEFNDELAHKIEAGSDMFVMPSRYEPCGLNQIYSIKYGTIPIVRATGGLDDVIVDFDEDNATGNGFKFGPATEEALYDAIKRAIELHKDEDAWKRLMVQSMSYDFSWEHSAGEYLKLYRNLIKG